MDAFNIHLIRELLCELEKAVTYGADMDDIFDLFQDLGAEVRKDPFATPAEEVAP
jgi:hypothetical protein